MRPPFARPVASSYYHRIPAPDQTNGADLPLTRYGKWSTK